jgi:type VI secretion system protein
MAIKLRVISDHYRDLGEHRSRVFGVNGGSIGRAPDNDWILPDPKRVLSGHHCEIEYRSGVFWLKDTSTNGVYVNESEDPAFTIGPIELQDGDRLRMGDYEVLVSLDERIDFLPAPGELQAAERQASAHHAESSLGAPLDLASLLSPRDAETSGSLRMRNAFGMKIPREERTPEEVTRPDEPPPAPHSKDRPFDVAPRPRTNGPAVAAPAPFTPLATVPVATPPRSASAPPPAASPAPEPQTTAAPAAMPVPAPSSMPPAAPAADTPVADWALKTRQITRQELAEAVARRQGRIEQRERAVPFHQQASTWNDLRSATQAFCRGAGIDPAVLSAEAHTMLPLLAGQLLREAVVGLTDILRARPETPGAATAAANGTPVGNSSNPLRTSTSIEQALQRLFESHGRLYGGPVDALRDVLQDIKDHDTAVQDASRAALRRVLEELAPANIADQFEHGRSRVLAPGQDPRPKYWEHYGEFYRVLTQQSQEGLPHAFVETFAQAYANARTDLRGKRRGRE